MTQHLHATYAKAACLIGLMLALCAPAAASTLQTFNNTAPITINTQGNATPYPSNITVTDVPTNFTRLEVQLNGFTHSFPDDVDIMLVGPQFQRTILMSDASGSRPGVSGLNLSFAQTALNPIADTTAPASGLFRPANYIESTGSSPVDTFPTPGPGALTDAPADLFVFNGINPNGVWSLFVVDDANGDFGSISGGWTLRFTAPTVFTVNSVADGPAGICNEVDCTLREAITAAQDGDLINFSTLFNTPQTINLLTALPVITRSITIRGTGANLLTDRRAFNAATEFRIFTIAGPITNGVAISGMTITGGNLSFSGAGIDSASHLTLTQVHLTRNTGFIGGGGLRQVSADGVIADCTFSDNEANEGGGIRFDAPGKTLRISNSTFSGNRSRINGAAISNLNGRLEVTNSTIANNTASGTIGGIDTFSLNAGNSATTTLRNTIVTNNTPVNLAIGTAGGVLPTVQTLGFNLSDNYNGVFTPIPGSDILSATPRLAPLALYGGQTPTHALLHGSPALNVGNASGQATDQRGQGRPGNGSNPNADIGAFEAQTPNVIIVNNINDSGAGSLRGAIDTLLNVGDPDVYDIQFDTTFFSAPRTITLASADLLINGNMTILAPGANLLTVSGGGNHRVFRVNPGRTATLSGMTITGGTGSDPGGGGILSNGNLTLTHSAVTGNQTGLSGGGILSGTAPGAILSVNNSTVSGNQASDRGGGIFNIGTTGLNNSTISGNSAFRTDFAGGGIFNSGSLTITNSTITDNFGRGGSGIFRFAGIVDIRNSIIAGNVNNATQPDVVSNGGTGVTSNGFNLIGNRGTVTFGATGDQSGTGAAPLNPLLGPLQNNGGTTNTHALLAGSPALDKGDRSGATVDQRGAARPFDFAAITNTADGSDIGAFEAQVTTDPIPTATASAPNISAPAGVPQTYQVSVTCSDDTAINVSTIDANDLVVTGPNGYSATPDSFSAPGGNGTPRTATYRLTAPGSQWAASGNGTYTISMRANQVSDVAGLFVQPGQIGAFTVNIQPVAPTVNYSPAAGSTINFPNGPAGNADSTINIQSSGGLAPGSVTVNGSAPSGFTFLVSPPSFSGTPSFPISANTQLSCIRGASAQTATLILTETPNPGSPVQRSWTLNCPAATSDVIFQNGFQ